MGIVVQRTLITVDFLLSLLASYADNRDMILISINIVRLYENLLALEDTITLR